MSQFVHNTFLTDDPGLAPLAQRGDAQPNLLHVLARQRWLFMLGVCVPLLAAAAYLAWTDPVYMASSRLSIQPGAPRIIGDSAPALAVGSGPAFLSAQCELLKSRTIVIDALHSLDVARMRVFADVADPVEYCRQNLTVDVGGRDGLITVSLLSAYPLESARIVNAIVDAYVNWQAGQRRSASGEVLRILEREKQKCQDDADGLQQSLADFRLANNVVSLEGDKGNPIIQRLTRLSEALTDAQVQVIAARTLEEAVKERSGDYAALSRLAGAQLNGGALAALEREISAADSALEEAKWQLASLKEKYSSRHPALQPALARVVELKQRIAERKDRYVQECLAAAQARLADARQREIQLQAAFDQQQNLAQTLSSQTAEYLRLEANLKRTEQLGENIDNRIREIHIADEAASLSINILERATGKDNPVRSHEARTIAYGLAAGLLLGCWLALAREMADKRLRGSAEAVAATELPVICVAPRLKAKVGAPAPDLMDACRTACTTLQFALGQQMPRAILVASPASGDGRTTMALHLAAALAWSGKHVLLLDADLKQPSLHRLVNAPNDAGLCEVLRDRLRLEQAISAIRPGALDLMSAGRYQEADAALLQSETFTRLLRELSRRYDHVVIDCGPVADLPDARAVAAVCDATLVVLRAGKSTWKQAKAAVEALRHVGANLVGIAVNAAPSGKTAFTGSGWCCQYPASVPAVSAGPGSLSMPGPRAPTVAAA